MGDVITGIDFAADNARERFLRHREAIGLRVLPVVDKEQSRQDTTPSEYVAPDGDCA